MPGPTDVIDDNGIDMGRITKKPNRYSIFLKTDTEYRTAFYKNRPKKRKTDPSLLHFPFHPPLPFLLEVTK